MTVPEPSCRFSDPSASFSGASARSVSLRAIPPARLLSSDRSGRLAAAIGVVALLGAIGAVVWEPWHGPIVLSLSPSHGVATGDLVAVPLVALAAVAGRAWASPRRPARGTARRASPGGRAGAAPAVVLGVLLLVVGVADLAVRGPLVPSGGGTIDGTVQSVAGRTPSRVGAWSYLALTWDGATLRLFVDGTQVSSRAATGTIRGPADTPLWIGGNHPYGEFFEGSIDEARVYDRALGEAELRADMATPVAAARSPRLRTDGGAGSSTRPTASPGPVAAYSFDAGSGASVVDESGNGNEGRISGATWTAPGRYGGGLNFDGADDVVRVEPSPSLNLDSGLTLSAWVRPSVAQSGWRTIVQREVDTYFLTASSDLEGLVGPGDDILAGAVAVAAAWYGVVLVGRRGRWSGGRRPSRRVAVGMVLVGWAVDVALVPSTSLFGPAALAVWLATGTRDRTQAVSLWLVAALLTLVTAASLVGLAGVGALMQPDDGGVARSAAVGLTLLVTGLAQLRYGRRPSLAQSG